MKKPIGLLLTLLLLLSLAACGGPGKEPEAQTAAGQDPAASASRDPYEDYNNHYMRWLGPPQFWADTEDYLFFHGRYLDKKTGDCEVYCSKPECTHQDPYTCEAYQSVLGVWDGRLITTGAVDQWHTGIFSQKLDGSERKLLRTLDPDEGGYAGTQLHRGRLFLFSDHGSVDDGVPTETMRLTVLDLSGEDTRVLMEDRVYPGGARGWLFFRENTAYLLIGYKVGEDAEEYPGCAVRELWTYDMEQDEIKLALADTAPEGILHGCWITKEGEIYITVEKDVEAEREEDWRWSYTLEKLGDGKFVELWEVPWEKGLGNSRISDGVVITEYADTFRYNKEVRFRIQDFEGKILADAVPPFPDFGGEADQLTFERFEPVWADESCLWMLIHLERPALNQDGCPTTQFLELAVKYAITDQGYSVAFAEPAGF